MWVELIAGVMILESFGMKVKRKPLESKKHLIYTKVEYLLRCRLQRVVSWSRTEFVFKLTPGAI
jgi:hypothetical protein